ncbi:hypothetical protein E1B28_013053 [Marasmius oreades]|uniref:Mid2 domain-containing protein n=1 Tax=Marasmius oreades TaxID=181124 RepID=A0A9P7RNW4_9AGAR|nr:uncharacterized protein E1B28_013053 [Marasmius oreades]KAG7087071.1 hypothetical protein E1B28_013053 [Marasmius oreades]
MKFLRPFALLPLFLHATLAFQISLSPSIVTVGVPVVASYTQDTDPIATEMRLVLIEPTARSSKFPTAPVESGSSTITFVARETGIFCLIGRSSEHPTEGQSHEFQAIIMGSDPGANNSSLTTTGSATAAPPTPASSTALTTSESSDPEPTTSQSFSGSSSPSHRSLSRGAIAGIAVGAATALIIVVLSLWMCYRRRRVAASWSWSSSAMQPFTRSIPIKESPEIKSQVSQVHQNESNSSSAIPNPPVNPIEPNVSRVPASREVIQHTDSGWRPPVSSDDHHGQSPIELPPAYETSI